MAESSKQEQYTRTKDWLEEHMPASSSSSTVSAADVLKFAAEIKIGDIRCDQCNVVIPAEFEARLLLRDTDPTVLESAFDEMFERRTTFKSNDHGYHRYLRQWYQTVKWAESVLDDLTSETTLSELRVLLGHKSITCRHDERCPSFNPDNDALTTARDIASQLKNKSSLSESVTNALTESHSRYATYKIEHDTASDDDDDID